MRRDYADLALRLKDDFFTDRTRVLMELVAEGWLVYENGAEGAPLPQPFFRVDLAKVAASSLPERLKARLTEREEFSCYEIDDLLLGHFEDLHSLWKRALIDLKLLHEGFGWYIETCVGNPEIRRYIDDEERRWPGVWGGVLKLGRLLKNEDAHYRG